MKYLFVLLMLVSNATLANKGYSTKLLSFHHLMANSESYKNEKISIRGFLLEDEGKFYFCMDMESCFTKGKERIQIITNTVKSSGVNYEYLKSVDKCHMELSGEYNGLGTDQNHWPLIGFIKISNHPSFNFTPDYSQINTSCKVFYTIEKHKKETNKE